jgi:hypothetical protein
MATEGKPYAVVFLPRSQECDGWAMSPAGHSHSGVGLRPKSRQLLDRHVMLEQELGPA